MNSIYLILCLNAVSPNPSETWSVIKKSTLVRSKYLLLLFVYEAIYK